MLTLLTLLLHSHTTNDKFYVVFEKLCNFEINLMFEFDDFSKDKHKCIFLTIFRMILISINHNFIKFIIFSEFITTIKYVFYVNNHTKNT